MKITIVSVGPCEVINVHRVGREPVAGVESVMLVDNGREFVVWRVYEAEDGLNYAYNGNYYGYDDRAAATIQFLSRSGLDRASLDSQYKEEVRSGRIRTLTD